VTVVDERCNGTRKRQDMARSGKDSAIMSKTLHLGRRSLVAAPPEHVTDDGLTSYGLEKIDLHKADTDPPSRWPMRMP
jgi:hypothetical protein